MKKCINCKTENDDKYRYCCNCGFDFNNVSTTDEIYDVDNYKEGQKLGLIAFLLYFGSPILYQFIAILFSFFDIKRELFDKISSILPLCPLAAIIIMIYGRIKYPKNKVLKTFMWIIISTFALGIILFIIFIFWCAWTCQGLSKGCS